MKNQVLAHSHWYLSACFVVLAVVAHVSVVLTLVGQQPLMGGRRTVNKNVDASRCQMEGTLNMSINPSDSFLQGGGGLFIAKSSKELQREKSEERGRVNQGEAPATTQKPEQETISNYEISSSDGPSKAIVEKISVSAEDGGVSDDNVVEKRGSEVFENSITSGIDSTGASVDMNDVLSQPLTNKPQQSFPEQESHSEEQAHSGAATPTPKVIGAGQAYSLATQSVRLRAKNIQEAISEEEEELLDVEPLLESSSSLLAGQAYSILAAAATIGEKARTGRSPKSISVISSQTGTKGSTSLPASTENGLGKAYSIITSTSAGLQEKKLAKEEAAAVLKEMPLLGLGDAYSRATVLKDREASPGGAKLDVSSSMEANTIVGTPSPILVTDMGSPSTEKEKSSKVQVFMEETAEIIEPAAVGAGAAYSLATRKKPGLAPKSTVEETADSSAATNEVALESASSLLAGQAYSILSAASLSGQRSTIGYNPNAKSVVASRKSPRENTQASIATKKGLGMAYSQVTSRGARSASQETNQKKAGGPLMGLGDAYSRATVTDVRAEKEEIDLEQVGIEQETLTATREVIRNTSRFAGRMLGQTYSVALKKLEEQNLMREERLKEIYGQRTELQNRSPPKPSKPNLPKYFYTQSSKHPSTVPPASNKRNMGRQLSKSVTWFANEISDPVKKSEVTSGNSTDSDDSEILAAKEFYRKHLLTIRKLNLRLLNAKLKEQAAKSNDTMEGNANASQETSVSETTPVKKEDGTDLSINADTPAQLTMK